jgi:two-component system, sensor histidine kinase and response regulator
MSEDSQSLILIIDDLPQNLLVLRAALERQSYKVEEAQSGRKALQMLESLTPDLILLDVMMPEMGGFEVCRKLKENPATAAIPIVFLTARTEQSDILEGFLAGGVDYITKPFHIQELLARVYTHVSLKQAQDMLFQHAAQLEKQAADLRQLNLEKDEFLAIVSHDLRSPLNAISGAAQILQDSSNKITATDIHGYSQMIERNAERMLAIISHLLDIHRLENGKIETHLSWFSLQELLEQTQGDYLARAQEKQQKLNLEIDPDLPTMQSDPLLLREILDNLVSNALKFSANHTEVTIRAYYNTEPLICIEIEDQGLGFNLEDQKRIFQKFARLSARPTAGEPSTGLGLSIALQLSQLLQGMLQYKQLPKGSLFRLSLPLLLTPKSNLKTN